MLIVEDEAPAARRLRRLVCSELSLDTDQCTLVDNLPDAARILAERHFDLLLLDLDLSGRDGLELLRTARSEPVAAVIVSANVDRALDAFDHDVVDFVAKPISAERLSRALARARERRAGEMRLVIRSLGRTDILPVRQVVRIAGADDYAEVTVSDGATYLHSETLDVLEKRLPPTFVRVHRSHLVNLEYVSQVRTLGSGRHCLVTRDEQEIPVSRRKWSGVREAVERFSGER